VRIIVEGPAGYPLEEAQRVARIIERALIGRDDTRYTAIVGVDNTEELVFAGPLWVITARVEGEAE